MEKTVIIKVDKEANKVDIQISEGIESPAEFLMILELCKKKIMDSVKTEVTTNKD